MIFFFHNLLSQNEFGEDMAHIINLALNDPDEMKLVRKKATNSVRSMFVKVSPKGLRCG